MPVIWGARVVGAENQAELGGARVGCVRGRRVGEHRGLVYCVDEVRVFPRKMAPRGSRHAITVCGEDGRPSGSRIHHVPS